MTRPPGGADSTRQMGVVRDIRPRVHMRPLPPAPPALLTPRPQAQLDRLELTADIPFDRLERLRLARAVVQLALAVLLLLITTVAGTLVVGALFGAWTLPIEH